MATELGTTEMGTTEERAAGYRTLAAEAEARAIASKFPEVRDNYLSLAKSWTVLALDAEAWAERIKPRR